MKIARYWARGTAEIVTPDGERVRGDARGWSNDSVEAAAAVARDIAKRVAARIASGESADKQYGYGDRPLPEPVLREFRNGGDGPAAVVTRNAYGAVVLNTRDLMFIDIDKEDKPESSGGLLAGMKSLFGKPKPEPVSAPAVSPIVTAIRQTAEQNSLAVRVYKTAAGYRVMVVNKHMQPASGQTDALLRVFHADELFIRLCKTQQSFRARLTPKPWRCNVGMPPASFPFASPQHEKDFHDWESEYNQAVMLYATCRFVGSFGAGAPESEFSELIAFHDHESKATSGLPLA